jgi:ABC-type transport system involved in multi-copper enzyme maturation permease subunit
MSNLLKADIKRYSSSIVYIIAVIFSFAIGVKIGVCAYGSFTHDGATYHYFNIDETAFVIGILVLLSAVSIIVGQDYSENTVRNKLICGYTKTQVYLSELLSAFLAATLLYAVTVIPFALFGIKAMRFFPAEEIALVFAVIYFIYICMTAICVAVCCLIKKRAVSLIVTAGIFVGLFLGSVSIKSALEQPQYQDRYDSSDVYIGMEKNDSYIENETARKALEIAFNANPAGQIVGFVGYLSHDVFIYTAEGRRTLETYPLYAVGLSAAVTAVGIAVYRKQNLR